jgi:hypothetical protein
MLITKKHLSRRTFLRGAGVSVALPLLEAMLPAQTPLRNTAANVKSRFTAIFFPHGMAPGYWVPKTEGAGFEFTPIMMPLEPLREHTVILSGLWSKSAEPPPGVSGADHWVASAFLCTNKPKKTAGADVKAQSIAVSNNRRARIASTPATAGGRATTVPAAAAGLPPADDDQDDDDALAQRQNASSGGLTPLVYAARQGDLESTKILLAAGADINQETAYGWTALLRQRRTATTSSPLT